MSERCPVDHGERCEMGLLACYLCGQDLQTIEEANAIREAYRMSHLFGADRVLHRAEVVCPVCKGRGFVRQPLAINPEEGE